MQDTAQPIISGTDGVPEGSMAWGDTRGALARPNPPSLLPASPLPPLGPPPPHWDRRVPDGSVTMVAQPKRLPGDSMPAGWNSNGVGSQGCPLSSWHTAGPCPHKLTLLGVLWGAGGAGTPPLAGGGHPHPPVPTSS